MSLLFLFSQSLSTEAFSLLAFCPLPQVAGRERYILAEKTVGGTDARTLIHDVSVISRHSIVEERVETQ